MTLSAFAWNIVRTYTLTPGRRYSFGWRYRLGDVRSAADNDYVRLPRHALEVGLRDGPAGRLAGPYGLGHAGRTHRAAATSCCNDVNRHRRRVEAR